MCLFKINLVVNDLYLQQVLIEVQYASNTSCFKCLDDSCKTCVQQPVTCTACIDGYYINLIDYTCTKCDWTCKTCTHQIFCYTCRDRHYLVIYNNISQFCQPCILGCRTCINSFQCQACIQNYYYSNQNKCLYCGKDCNNCVDKIGCTNCTQDTLSCSNGTCYCCPPGCKSCNNASECLSCFYQHTLINKTCYSCPLQCGSCYQSLTCKACRTGFYLNGSICNYYGPYCMIYKNYVGCTKSDPNYSGFSLFILGGRTYFCAKGCKNCTDQLTCSNCIKGYYLVDQTTCQSCNKQCDICIDQRGCCNKTKDRSLICSLQLTGPKTLAWYEILWISLGGVTYVLVIIIYCLCYQSGELDFPRRCQYDISELLLYFLKLFLLIMSPPFLLVFKIYQSIFYLFYMLTMCCYDYCRQVNQKQINPIQHDLNSSNAIHPRFRPNRWIQLRQNQARLNKEDPCVICHCSPGNVMTSCTCRYAAHPQCASEWIKRKKSCFMCRKKVSNKVFVFCSGCRNRKFAAKMVEVLKISAKQLLCDACNHDQ